MSVASGHGISRARPTWPICFASFEIPIDRVECKFKLSQNRPIADRKRVVDALELSGKPDEGVVASLMRESGVLEEE